MNTKFRIGLATGILLVTGSVMTMIGSTAFSSEVTTPTGKDGCEPARWKNAFTPASAHVTASAGQDTSAQRSDPDRLAQGMMMQKPGHGRGMGMMGRGHGMGKGGMGMMGRGNPVRHRYVMMNGLPEGYARMRNPLKADAKTLAKGKALFMDNCASCHGKTGRGDGEAGKALNPPPADLAFVIDKPIASDGFLMWSISEGGEALKTDMPAFKDVLSEKERWQIITWLRHGLKR